MANLRDKNKLGQYFTPKQICDFMVSLSSKQESASVLEPSSGEGAFLDALSKAGFTDVTGVEIDSDLAKHSVFEVHNQSFITWQEDKKYDLIIGNPPYIRWKDLEEEQKSELVEHRMFGSLVNSLSDYLLPFIALSIEKLKPEGELIFITPSFWLQTKHSSSLREYLSTHGQITDLVDFGESRIFKSVATSLIIFKFVKSGVRRETRLHRFIGSKVGSSNLDLKDIKLFRSETVSHFESKGKFVPAFNDEVSAPIALEMACRSNLETARLGEVVRIANGMVTGLDEAFRLSGDFVSQLPASELSGVSKVVKGKDLQRIYSSNFSYYIDIDPSLPEDVVYSRYPNLLEALLPFKERLMERYVNGSELMWWHWSFYRSSNFHRSDITKGFVPGKERLTHRPSVRFSLASKDVIATQDVTAFAPLPATRESINYIVAFLNLSVVSDWIRVFGLMKGGVAEFSEKPLSEIPFRRIDWSNELEVQIHDSISQIAQDSSMDGADLSKIEEEFRAQFRKLMPELSL